MTFASWSPRVMYLPSHCTEPGNSRLLLRVSILNDDRPLASSDRPGSPLPVKPSTNRPPFASYPRKYVMPNESENDLPEPRAFLKMTTPEFP